MFHKTLYALSFGLCLTTAMAARADTLRVPKSGTPAFVADVASGWTPNYDDYGNLVIAADDHSSFVLLRILDDPGIGDRTLEDVATEVLKAAEATPFSRSGPGGIAGHPGESFYSQMTSNSTTLDVRLVVVKLDTAHDAVLAVIEQQTITSAQTANLSDAVGRIGLSDR